MGAALTLKNNYTSGFEADGRRCFLEFRAPSRGQQPSEMLQSASNKRPILLASELPEGVGAFGRFLFLDAQLPVL